MFYEIKNFLNDRECDALLEKRVKHSEFNEDGIIQDLVIKSDNQEWKDEFKIIKERTKKPLEKIFQSYYSLFPIEMLTTSHIGFLSESHGDFTELHYDWDIIKVDGKTISKPLVMIVYLNDVDQGGDIFFPISNRTVKTEKGKAAIFPCHFTFPHMTTPVINSNKHIMRVTFCLTEEIFTVKGLEL